MHYLSVQRLISSVVSDVAGNCNDNALLSHAAAPHHCWPETVPVDGLAVRKSCARRAAATRPTVRAGGGQSTAAGLWQGLAFGWRINLKRAGGCDRILVTGSRQAQSMHAGLLGAGSFPGPRADLLSNAIYESSGIMTGRRATRPPGVDRPNWHTNRLREGDRRVTCATYRDARPPSFHNCRLRREQYMSRIS